ncbi:MAG: hypothetical protein JWR19_4613 [Pedosphaera sp.]|jgi:uncharacterized protein YijF (DUF1287 family)|nr:hypothetical protein [Pedosphaera sp.]
MKSIVAILILATAVCSAEVKPKSLVTAARNQIGVTVAYDPAYRKLDYPGGDVPKKVGVCTDVIIRAMREQGIDLQKEVHEDMVRAFEAYPQKWGLKKPDSNIDHRRVLNLMTYFSRQGYAQSAVEKATNFAAGDIVAWDLGEGVTHIGIVSDKTGPKGTPLIIHNIGNGTQEEDILFQFHIIGHYRCKGSSSQ